MPSANRISFLQPSHSLAVKVGYSGAHLPAVSPLHQEAQGSASVPFSLKRTSVISHDLCVWVTDAGAESWLYPTLWFLLYHFSRGRSLLVILLVFPLIGALWQSQFIVMNSLWTVYDSRSLVCLWEEGSSGFFLSAVLVILQHRSVFRWYLREDSMTFMWAMQVFWILTAFRLPAG